MEDISLSHGVRPRRDRNSSLFRTRVRSRQFSDFMRPRNTCYTRFSMFLVLFSLSPFVYHLLSASKSLHHLYFEAGNVVVFVSGQGSRSTIVEEDLRFAGGVIQVIDSFLIPPTNVIETTTAFNLTSFQSALYASKENGTFMNTSNVTIFAPSNSAFEALGPAISSMTVEQLASIMDYHLIPDGVFYSTSFLNGTTYTTQQGSKVTVRRSGNNAYINGAQLLATDILLENGVLHVLDNVLNPQVAKATPNPTLATQKPAYASATAVNNLPFTDDIPCTSSFPVTTSSKSVVSVKALVTSTATFQSSSSKAVGALVARETGFGAAGLMVALGGTVMIL